VVVLSPARKAFCVKCNARWIQEGSFQRAIRPAKQLATLAPPLTEPGA
jgi:hypothetical protein